MGYYDWPNRVPSLLFSSLYIANQISEPGSKERRDTVKQASYLHGGPLYDTTSYFYLQYKYSPVLYHKQSSNKLLLLLTVESTALSSDGSAHARYKSWRAGLLLMKIAPREQRVAGALSRYDLPSVRGGSYLSAVAGRIARSSPVTRQLIRYYRYIQRPIISQQSHCQKTIRDKVALYLHSSPMSLLPIAPRARSAHPFCEWRRGGPTHKQWNQKSCSVFGQRGLAPKTRQKGWRWCYRNHVCILQTS